MILLYYVTLMKTVGNSRAFHCLFLMFTLNFSAFAGKIEAPLSLVFIASGDSIRENTVKKW